MTGPSNRATHSIDRGRLAESSRQTLHIVSGLWAFCIRWVGPLPLMGLALVALVFNLWFFPRLGGRRLWRAHEVTAGRAVGIVIYPLSIVILLIVFYSRPEVAAAGWGLLAFSDGAATLIGRRWGRTPLPWNPEKSWSGFMAFVLSGWLAVTLLVEWTAPGRYDLTFLTVVGAATALVAALLESSPQKLDDNLGVPLLASLVLVCLLASGGGWVGLLEPSFLRNLALGLVLNVMLTIGAYRLATLDARGSVVACCLGTVIFAFLGWAGYLVLLTFFVLGSLATRIGFDSKRRNRTAQGDGGRRGTANALANGAVATACAVWVGVTPYETLFVAAFAGSLGAAAADTVESEIGQLWGRPTVLITSWKPVSPGVDGGISVVGTLAGFLAACVTIGMGSIAGLYSPVTVLPLSLLATVATLIESLAGATLERSGLLNNQGVNFLNTLTGALLGAGMVWIMG